MTSNELLIIVFCACLGYWVVSKVFARNEPSPTSAGSSDREANSQTETDRPDNRAPAWHEVLGLSPRASDDEVKTAYRLLMLQYHPDKVASLGKELRDLAEEKSKQIGAAYQEALRSRSR